MGITRRKALYIYLSSILGILLFSMFHRSIFVMYEIIGNFYPEIQWLHLPFRIMATVDFFSFVLAVFLGGWYGVWIGLSWYKMIYEERGVKTWFHGFVPHNWRKHKTNDSELDFINSVAQKTTKSAPKRIVVTSETRPAKRVDTFRSFRANTEPSMPWDIEDAELEPRVAKKVSKKRSSSTAVRSISKTGVRKVARKAVAKKKVTV